MDLSTNDDYAYAAWIIGIICICLSLLAIIADYVFTSLGLAFISLIFLYTGYLSSSAHGEEDIIIIDDTPDDVPETTIEPPTDTLDIDDSSLDNDDSSLDMNNSSLDINSLIEVNPSKSRKQKGIFSIHTN